MNSLLRYIILIAYLVLLSGLSCYAQPNMDNTPLVKPDGNEHLNTESKDVPVEPVLAFSNHSIEQVQSNLFLKLKDYVKGTPFISHLYLLSSSAFLHIAASKQQKNPLFLLFRNFRL